MQTPIPENKKVYLGPNVNQSNPPMLLASNAIILAKLEKNPMAVAVSVLSAIFDMRALDIPSVALAYIPYIKKSIPNIT